MAGLSSVSSGLASVAGAGPLVPMNRFKPVEVYVPPGSRLMRRYGTATHALFWALMGFGAGTMLMLWIFTGT